MAIRICPKCDINFLRDDESVCPICRRESKGEAEKASSVEMCSSCGEHPCEPGEDLCIFCLNERKLQDAEDSPEIEPILLTNEVEIGMDEIDVPITQDIPDTELRVIHEELGLDEEEDDTGEPEAEEAVDEMDEDVDLMDIGISLSEYDDGSEDDEDEDEEY